MEVTVLVGCKEKSREVVETLMKKGLASFVYLIEGVRAFRKGKKEGREDLIIFETDWILIGKCINEMKNITKEISILGTFQVKGIRFLRDMFGLSFRK